MMRLRVAVLAMADVAVGGGLLIGGIALLVVRNLVAIPYTGKTAITLAALWIGAICASFAGFVFIEQKGKRSLRAHVALTATVGIGAVVLMHGLFPAIKLRTPLLIGGIGLLVLTTGTAIWRGMRWGGYLQLLLPAAATIYFAAEGRTFLTGLMLFVLLALIDPVMAFFGSDEAAPGGIARVLRAPSLLAFALLAALFTVAWLMVPLLNVNLLNALERASQKRAAQDIRVLQNAAERYAETHKHYPSGAEIPELSRMRDPWGNPYEYHRVFRRGVDGYVIRSAAADGVYEHRDPTAYHDGAVEGVERDLVVSTISESQWPAGMMSP